jgi:hypothetical protein
MTLSIRLEYLYLVDVGVGVMRVIPGRSVTWLWDIEMEAWKIVVKDSLCYLQ